MKVINMYTIANKFCL